MESPSIQSFVCPAKLIYVTGRGVGARYDGTYSNSTRVGDCGCKTGSASSFSQEYKVFLRKYWEAQVRDKVRDLAIGAWLT